MRARRPLSIRLARVLLALIFVGSVAGLAYLFVQQRDGDQESRAATEPEPFREQNEYAVQGKNVVFTARDGQQTRFQIEGDEVRADPENNIVFLERVAVRLDRGRGPYRLSGGRAAFNRETLEARIEGDVVVEGPDGFVAYTEWLELEQGGRLLEASRGTELELGPRIVGRADTLSIDFELDLVSLGGGVLVTTRAGLDRPFAMRSERVNISRSLRRVHAQGGVELAAPWGQLSSQDLAIDVDAENRIRFLRALWTVWGWFVRSAPEVHLASEPDDSVDSSGESGTRQRPTIPDRNELWQRELPPTRTELSGVSLAVAVDAATQTPSRLDLDGLRRHPAVLMTFEPKELRRRLQAVEIQAVLVDGEITGADAVGPVRLAQLTGDREDRYGTSDRAVLRFDAAGAVRSVQMIGAVHLVEGELVASGQRATLDLASERIQLTGEATVTSPRGTVTAPSVVYDQRRQLATAKDGARAVLDNPDDERLGAVVLGGAQGPIRVEAEEAILRQGPGEIIFRGQVRAWQEANRLLADRLRADDQRGQISASGNVETVWYPTDPLAEDQRGGAGEPAVPVEIAADLMNYDRDDGRLRYQGNVVALQLGRELSCQVLTVFLDPDGAAKRLVCEGSVSLYDPELSRRASGDRAVYEPEVGEMRMDGNPVRLEDPKLGVLEGSPLWYRFETGEFRMGAEATGSGDG